MPIRVECSRCRDVTHFADNDAGLAVACVACGQHLRVPNLAAKAAAPQYPGPLPPLPDEPPPLFANVRHDADVSTASPPLPPPANVASRSTKRRPASGARWRTYGLIAGLVGAGVAAAVYQSRTPKTVSVVAQTQPVTQPVAVALAPVAAASQPATPTAKVETPATKPVAPVVPPPPAVAARAEPVRPYTPANAPVGFVGLERIEIRGERMSVDSYHSGAGRYGGDNVRPNARLLSNGEIAVSGDGAMLASVRPGPGQTFRTPKRVTISGPAEPLAAKVSAPPVRLDPFAQDSNNAALPPKYFKNGNLVLIGDRVVAIPPGVYYLNDVVIEPLATLLCDGPVTLLISGQLTVLGNIETSHDLPANCRVRVTGSREVTIGRKTTLYLDLYAPNSTVNVDGKGEFYGSLVAKTLRVQGNRSLHFDEALLPGEAR
jgi:hypothetical protein